MSKAQGELTPKALRALELLVGTSQSETISSSALARKLWPEKLAACATSARRKGYARAAGAFYSNLARRGLVSHWVDGFTSGYYITRHGEECLKELQNKQRGVNK